MKKAKSSALVALKLALLATLFVFQTSCHKNSSSTAPLAAGADIVIGEYGSMTGSESTFGTQTHKGIQMAVDEANASGGVKGHKIKLISYDDEGKSDEAVTAVTKLITQDKVQLVLGEVASSRSIAAGAVAQQYKVPLISPSSTNPKVTQTGDYVFRVCFIDPFQGTVAAKFAIENLKLKKAAVFRDIRSDYSVGLSNYFSQTFKQLGGEIVADVSYSGGDLDFKSQLTSIKGKKPDLIYIPGYYTEVGLIARQARELNYKGVLIGGDGWDSEKLTEIGGNAIVGAYFSTHYSAEDRNPVVQNFVNHYKAKWGEVPGAMAAMGYDAAYVAFDAVKRAPEITSQALRDAIATTKNFQAVTGIITLNENRDAVKPAVVLKVAGPNKYSFVTTINP